MKRREKRISEERSARSSRNQNTYFSKRKTIALIIPCHCVGGSRWPERATIKTLQNACSAGIERKSGWARDRASLRQPTERFLTNGITYNEFLNLLSFSLSFALSILPPYTRYRPRQARHQHLVARLQPSPPPPPSPPKR